MDADELTVELHSDADHLILKVRGVLDLESVGRLRTALGDACADEQCDVTVDLTDVRFFDALTVGALAATARRMRNHGCRFVVNGLSSLQERMLRICGLEDVVTTG